MVSVLTVSDEVMSDAVIDGLCSAKVRSSRVDLVLGAGDLPFDYLEYLSDALNAPCVFVPGNHDRSLSGYTAGRSGWTRAGLPAQWPGPCGAQNADARVVRAAGLRIAGLGGSIRYNGGPNQWTENQQRRRATGLACRHRWSSPRGVGVDILLTHSPARGVGDAEDPPHRGFECLDRLTARLRPQAFIHGHIHPYGRQPPDGELHGAIVINTVGYCLLDITPRADSAPDGICGTVAPTITRRRYGT